MAPELREPLTRALGVDEADVFPVDGLLDLKDLWDVYKVSGFADLRDRPWTPVTQPRLLPDDDEPPDVMAAMRRGDLLCTTPTTRSPPRSSAWWSRRWPTPTCWPSR